MKRFILTGAPGSGKTTIINALQELGFNVVPESATEIIAQCQGQGNLTPWESLEFIDNIIEAQKERQLIAQGKLQFYDRSPFCTYALAKFLGFPLSATLLAEIDRCLKRHIYRPQVFFIENLGKIENTDARQISFEAALIFEAIHREVYKHFGFERISIPKDSVEARCALILCQC